jgi:hypothetical protein
MWTAEAKRPPARQPDQRTMSALGRERSLLVDTAISLFLWKPAKGDNYYRSDTCQAWESASNSACDESFHGQIGLKVRILLEESDDLDG